jgi:hypothetical protein
MENTRGIIVGVRVYCLLGLRSTHVLKKLLFSRELILEFGILLCIDTSIKTY